MLRFIAGIFVVLHGLVHLLYAAQSQRLLELQPGMDWPEGSWTFAKLLGDRATSRLAATRSTAAIACVLAAIGFVAGGAGIIARKAWWRPAVEGSAMLSAALVIVFWNGQLQRLADQGLIALLIDAAILVALLILR